MDLVRVARSALGRTSFFSEMSGQSSVEAALLLPVLLVLLAMLMQPACLLYTKSVMRGAAAEVARVAATWDEGDDSQLREYALRRLRAVPEVSAFHVGGESDWKVEVTGMGGPRVQVVVEGHAKPLPVLGGLAEALETGDANGVLLRVEDSEQVRPEWVGGGYDGWIGMWGA